MRNSGVASASSIAEWRATRVAPARRPGCRAARQIAPAARPDDVRRGIAVAALDASEQRGAAAAGRHRNGEGTDRDLRYQRAATFRPDTVISPRVRCCGSARSRGRFFDLAPGAEHDHATAVSRRREVAHQ
jgi:hypothetical protein